MFSHNFYTVHSNRSWIGLLSIATGFTCFLWNLYINVVLIYFYCSLLKELDFPQPAVSRSILDRWERSKGSLPFGRFYKLKVFLPYYRDGGFLPIYRVYVSLCMVLSPLLSWEKPGSERSNRSIFWEGASCHREYFLLALSKNWYHWVFSLVSVFLLLTFSHVASATSQLVSTTLSYILESRDCIYLLVSQIKKVGGGLPW